VAQDGDDGANVVIPDAGHSYAAPILRLQMARRMPQGTGDRVEAFQYSLPLPANK
jgi:hypothetical protein